MPTKYSKQMIINICDRLANGESIRSICRDKDMPTWETIRTWLRKKEGFQEQEPFDYIAYTHKYKYLVSYLDHDILDLMTEYEVKSHYLENNK